MLSPLAVACALTTEQHCSAGLGASFLAQEVLFLLDPAIGEICLPLVWHLPTVHSICLHPSAVFLFFAHAGLPFTATLCISAFIFFSPHNITANTFLPGQSRRDGLSTLAHFFSSHHTHALHTSSDTHSLSFFNSAYNHTYPLHFSFLPLL